MFVQNTIVFVFVYTTVLVCMQTAKGMVLFIQRAVSYRIVLRRYNIIVLVFIQTIYKIYSCQHRGRWYSYSYRLHTSVQHILVSDYIQHILVSTQRAVVLVLIQTTAAIAIIHSRDK